MDWAGRLGRIGALAGAAGAAACGRTVTPASPESLRPAAACFQPARPPGADSIGTTGAPTGRLTFAIADEADSESDGERPAARGLLDEIAAALPAEIPLQVPNHCTATPSDTPSDTPGNTPAGNTVVVHRVLESGARDALDQGIGVLVTRDRSVEAYAAAHTGLAVVPLPWDRTYLLVVPRGPQTADSAGTPIRAALAADALRADARPVGLDGRSRRDSACHGHPASRSLAGLDITGAERSRDTGRVVFDAADPVARFLAERVAVLASTRSAQLSAVAPTLDPGGAEMSVTGLSSRVFTHALQDGRSPAFIVMIPFAASLSCADAPAPGVTPAGVGPGIIPLIETRAVAIVRLDLAARLASAAHSATVVVDDGGAP
jgi:hypothetical protein